MLRVTVHPAKESVLLVAQTRDRNGHAADASDVTDPTFGATPQFGYATWPGATVGGTYPQVDIDRVGLFDSIVSENDTQTNNALPAFYEYTQELSRPAQDSVEVPWPARNPNELSETLWMYVGSEFSFRSVYFEIADSGVYGSADLHVQYWNGSSWAFLDVTEGSRLDAMRGASDQISWGRLDDWFPCIIGHQFHTVEGSRKTVSRELFWVRIRLRSITGFTSLPTISGVWEGDPDAESVAARWPLVTTPNKIVVARCPMLRDPNAHLSTVPVVSRKAPATIGGLLHFGRGDYYLRVPTYYGEDAVGKNPATISTLVQGQDKNGTAVTVPVSAEAVLLQPGHYRARVYAEVPNLDANVMLAQSGHPMIPEDPTLIEPGTPESAFDPSWEPTMAAATSLFDIRLAGAKACCEVQRNTNDRDVYAVWLEVGGERLPLVNQGDAKDYMRLQVTDVYSGALLIDTMDGNKSTLGAPITPVAAPTSNPDPHVFRYIEDDADRKLADRGMYLLRVTIVRGGQAITTDTSISFFA